MKRAQNFDSKTHLKKWNPTFRTKIGRKSLKYLFLETPCTVNSHKFVCDVYLNCRMLGWRACPQQTFANKHSIRFLFCASTAINNYQRLSTSQSFSINMLASCCMSEYWTIKALSKYQWSNTKTEWAFFSTPIGKSYGLEYVTTRYRWSPCPVQYKYKKYRNAKIYKVYKIQMQGRARETQGIFMCRCWFARNTKVVKQMLVLRSRRSWSILGLEK